MSAPMASRQKRTTTSTTIPSPRPSTAIQEGADRLVELLEREKEHLVHLYHGALRGLEARQKRAQEEHEVQQRSADRKLQEQGQRIQALTTNLAQTQSYAADVTGGLEALRLEHEALKVALGQAGLVYADGQLHFNDKAARIVDEFVMAAKIQQDALRSSPLVDHRLFERDDALSGPVGPAEFFDVLSGVIEKGRKFAENVEKYQRPRSKPNDTDKQSVPTTR